MSSNNNITNDTTVIIELHPCEIQLIRALRYNWKFGEVTIIVQDGIPVRIKRVWENIDLTKKGD